MKLLPLALAFTFLSSCGSPKKAIEDATSSSVVSAQSAEDNIESSTDSLLEAKQVLNDPKAKKEEAIPLVDKALDFNKAAMADIGSIKLSNKEISAELPKVKDSHPIFDFFNRIVWIILIFAILIFLVWLGASGFIRKLFNFFGLFIPAHLELAAQMDAKKFVNGTDTKEDNARVAGNRLAEPGYKRAFLKAQTALRAEKGKLFGSNPPINGGNPPSNQ